MRIALLLTGYTRTYKECFPSIKKNMLSKYPMDIFCSTWEFQEDGSKTNASMLCETYNTKKIIIVPQPDDPIFKKTKDLDIFVFNARAKEHGVFWADRLARQWKLVQHCFNLIEDSYDLVIRTRYDLYLNDFSFENIKKNTIYHPKDIGGWDFTDHMAYGDYHSMKVYCNLFSNIQELYESDVDVTHAVDMPKKYLLNNFVSIKSSDKILYRLYK
jgi:hypothetical protein